MPEAVACGPFMHKSAVNDHAVNAVGGGCGKLGHAAARLGKQQIEVARQVDGAGPAGRAKLKLMAELFGRVRIEFAAEAGLSLAPSRIRQLAPAVEAISGFQEGFRLSSAMIQERVKFTAILAFDDLTGLGAIRALRQAGRHVPEDCSVIGFDDVPHAAVSTPGLTTIRQPMEQMGSLAAEWVVESLDSPKALEAAVPVLSDTLHLLQPELVVRDSTTRWLG